MKMDADAMMKTLGMFRKPRAAQGDRVREGRHEEASSAPLPKERHMIRSVASKVIGVGRATVFLVGLAVILALMFGVAATALAGTGMGATFNLGKTNTVDAISRLVGSTASSMLLVDNNGAGTALDLRVGDPAAAPATKTTPPMKVDSQARVDNLNAQFLDGKSSAQFADVSEVSGQDSQTVNTSVLLPTTGETGSAIDLVSVTVMAPASGFVVLTGSGALQSNHVSGTISAPRVFLTKTSQARDFTNSSIGAVPDSAPSGRYQYPFGVTRVFPVDAGEHTFYMTGDMAYRGQAWVVRPSLTAIFVKNQV
jgi:hypothetical protein